MAQRVGGHFVETDVSDLEANRAAVAFATERAGGLDLAYLNAGVAGGPGLGDDFDLAAYRRAMGINLDGVVFGTHAVLPALRERGGGAIVATASLAGLMGMPLDPVYTANKHAVVGLARALGPALAPEGIRFNAICPGFAESALTAPIRERLVAAGFEIITAEAVADGVRALHERRGRRVLVRAAGPRARPVPVPERAGPEPLRPSDLGYFLRFRSEALTQTLRLTWP